jgi:hypothetical protein
VGADALVDPASVPGQVVYHPEVGSLHVKHHLKREALIRLNLTVSF